MARVSRQAGRPQAARQPIRPEVEQFCPRRHSRSAADLPATAAQMVDRPHRARFAASGTVPRGHQRLDGRLRRRRGWRHYFGSAFSETLPIVTDECVSKCGDGGRKSPPVPVDFGRRADGPTLSPSIYLTHRHDFATPSVLSLQCLGPKSGPKIMDPSDRRILVNPPPRGCESTRRSFAQCDSGSY